jgi:DNA-binding transcriptional MerR regulator
MTDTLLKVGELARRTGMTVRMLHHYDAIGLLRPSAHSEAGYRLYNRNDVARLHAIQALRQIGLPLNEVGNLLSGEPEPLPRIVQRQITALEHQIEQANELCGRLRLLQSRLADGVEPNMQEWLSMLSAMSAYGKYFTADELKKIFENWKATEPQWQQLIAEIRAAMKHGLDPESMQMQPLARRWMDLSVRWMQGDYELMKRWEKMYLHEPAAKGRNGVETELIHYINKAVDLRVAAWLKYFTADELEQLNVELADEWEALAACIRKLINRKASLTGKPVRELFSRLDDLTERTVRHDARLKKKFTHAQATDPVLQAGSFFTKEMQEFLWRAWNANNPQSN